MTARDKVFRGRHARKASEATDGDSQVVLVKPLDQFGNVISGSGGGGGSGGAAASYQSPGDFTAAYASATTLNLSKLPFPPLFEQFVQIAEYDGDNLVNVYLIEDTDYDWTWTPGADTSAGVLSVATATFGATNTFVVQIRGPERDIMEMLTDFSGPYLHQSPRDFTAAYASATTLDLSGMAMDPDKDDIHAVVEIATGGLVRVAYSRKEWAFTWAAGATGAGVLTVANATFQATSTFIVFIEGPEHNTSAANTARTTATRVKHVQHVDEFGNPLVTPKPDVTNATGSAAIATSTAVSADFRLVAVTCHFSAAPSTSENFTVSLDANDGSAYDTTLLSVDPSADGVTDISWEPDTDLYFESGDEIAVAYANTDTVTYGLRIVTEKV